MRGFLHSQKGSSSVDFVGVALGFFAILFFILEATLYLFFTESLQKAAQAGVRAAVVSPPLVAGFPLVVVKSNTGIYGYKCSDVSAPCVPFATQTCSGGSCDPVPFTRILNHMNGYSGLILPANVTVTYTDVGLGFAGGPTVPMVTVTVENVPYQTGIIGLLLTNAGVLASLPAQSASMTGEDLAL
jgi:hypothetical protein